MNHLKCEGRGFASMDPVKQRDIAAQGGRAAHASGNAHAWTSAEASAAARKGHAKRAAARANPAATYETQAAQKPAEPKQIITESFPGSRRIA